MRRRHRRLVSALAPTTLALTVALAMLGAGDSGAAADVTGTCEGTASFEQGTEADGPFTIDAGDIGDEVIVVPRSDVVDWTGSVGGPPGEYAGKIVLDLPPLFPDLTIASWHGDSTTTSNSGVEDYDLPSIVPAGVTIRVVGEHTDDNGVCSGVVDVEIEGGAFDSPIAAGSLALTGVTGVGLLGMLRPLFRFRRWS